MWDQGMEEGTEGGCVMTGGKLRGGPLNEAKPQRMDGRRVLILNSLCAACGACGVYAGFS